MPGGLADLCTPNLGGPTGEALRDVDPEDLTDPAAVLDQARMKGDKRPSMSQKSLPRALRAASLVQFDTTNRTRAAPMDGLPSTDSTSLARVSVLIPRIVRSCQSS
jgi:hypothetical protein